MSIALTITLIYSGTMLRYDDGVMAQAVLNQANSGNLELVAGELLSNYVALIDCAYLGHRVLIEWPDGERTWHYVGDCAQDKHLERRRRRNTPVEVSYRVAMAHCAKKGRYCLPLDGPLPGVRVWEPLPETNIHPY